MDKKIEPKHLLTIKTFPHLDETKEGILLNDGYAFDVDGSLPEVADAIVKFAMELPANGFGEGSDKFFIELINTFYNDYNNQKGGE